MTEQPTRLNAQARIALQFGDAMMQKELLTDQVEALSAKVAQLEAALEAASPST